jgi:hypothetical protein
LFKLDTHVDVSPSVGVGTYLAVIEYRIGQNQVALRSAIRWCDRAAEADGL